MQKAIPYQDLRGGDTMCPLPPPGVWSDKNTPAKIGLKSSVIVTWKHANLLSGGLSQKFLYRFLKEQKVFLLTLK